MRKRSHITLEHIARRLNVSRVTVSKALRGHTDISTETTRRVREVALELGYMPNIIARSLSARRSHMIGLVVPKIAHAFFGTLIEGVYDTAFDSKYETILTVSQENAEREWKHLQTLVAMRVDGILISISEQTGDDKRFRWIKKSGVPLVFVDRRPETPLAGFSTVLCDDRTGAFQAVEHAIKVGYRKIGFVGGNPQINIARQRLRGLEEAAAKYQIPLDPAWVVHGGFGKDDGYAGVKQMVNRGSLPEFVLAATYPVALGIYEAAADMGIRIPDDLDIICFGDSDVGRFLSPAISVVRQPARDLGIRAVELLLERVAGHETSAEQHIVLPTELVLRETCVTKRAGTRTPLRA